MPHGEKKCFQQYKETTSTSQSTEYSPKGLQQTDLTQNLNTVDSGDTIGATVKWKNVSNSRPTTQTYISDTDQR